MSLTRSLRLLIVTFALVNPSLLFATDLRRLVESTGFIPLQSHDLENARLTAIGALAQLDQRLTAEAYGATWQSYLKLSSLSKALREPVSLSVLQLPESKEIDKEIEATRQQLVGNHSGLEIDEISQLRAQLTKYISLRLDAREQQSLAEEFEQHRQAVAARLSVTPLQIDQALFRDLESHAGWFKAHHQCPLLVELFEQWSRPNMLFELTQEAMQVITRTAVHEIKPIDRHADGRRIQGHADIVGTAGLLPVEGDLPGECKVLFTGNMTSYLSGGQGPVSFRLSGYTQLTAENRVVFDDENFLVFPAIVCANTDLRTDCVSTKFRGGLDKLVRKIATKKIAEERPEASRDISKEAAEEFLSEFAEKVRQEIADAEREFKQELIFPLVRMDVRPRQFDFTTNSRRLRAELLVDANQGVTAFDEPPSPTGIPYHISTHVHESTINRIADRLLSGEEIDDFSKLAGRLSASSSEQLRDALPKGIGITFARERPLTVRFEDDKLIVQVRGSNYRVDDLVLVAMDIQLQYRIVSNGSMVKLLLEGEPVITPPESGRGGRFFYYRNILKRRLVKELPKEQELKPFPLSAPADRLGTMRYTGFKTQSGWLNVQLLGDLKSAL